MTHASFIPTIWVKEQLALLTKYPTPKVLAPWQYDVSIAVVTVTVTVSVTTVTVVTVTVTYSTDIPR